MIKPAKILFPILALFAWGAPVLQAQADADGMPTAKSPPAAEISLVSNVDFSAATKDPNWPDDWGHPKGVTWETENGFHYLRFQVSTPAEEIMVYREVTLPAPPPAGVELRVRVRYSDVKPGKNSWFDARIMGKFLNAERQELIKPGFSAPYFRGTSDGWINKSYLFRVSPKAKTLVLMPALFHAAAGTFDLAKIEVIPVTEDQLPKPPPIVPSVTIVPAGLEAMPPELHVVGNQLETAAGAAVWLQGLCVDSLEWSAGGECILQSIPVATEQWKSNVIRLPVKGNFWFGQGPWQKKEEGGMSYRRLVDAAIQSANSRGAYLVLDLHGFGPPTEEAATFWKDAAVRYKDHPGVIFELFNEPHSMSWKVWRDGGLLHGAENAHIDKNAKENNQVSGSDESTIGLQALVDAVRSTGARNLIIAGGLDWGYDLSGVARDFALHDKPGADGIMYSSHIYPWKKDWQGNTLDAAAKYPVFIGEVGTPPDWKGFTFIPENERFEDLSKGEWAPDMIGLIQKHKLNWTGFSFHPACGPCVILDWKYTPTPYWGVFVKDALAGKQFEVKRMR